MLKKIKDVIKFTIAFFWSFFLRKKGIWIITERRYECKDNGYHLFKYIRCNHSNINAYYAIEKSSMQKEKIEEYGNILNFNSIKHYAYALAADKLIGAFLPCGIPDSFCFYKFGKKILRGKTCFLQHGIIKEKIESLMYKNTNLDLFISGARPEFNYIKKFFGYPKGNVKFTGLARFDNLYNTSKETNKFILLMPTWRKNLPSKTWGEQGTTFETSKYFQIFKHLLSNKCLIKLLEDNAINLVFYPHHEIQDKLKMFSSLSKNVILADEKKYDVQALLKNAYLLITDYSSVAFDFAYMNKPILYYQFDEQEYYSTHYQRGYFDYDKMGFGIVCHEENLLVQEIERCINRKFKNYLVYEERIENFFEYRDKKNCERIFKEILNLR